MKRTSYLVAGLLAMSLTISCGQSNKEKEAQRVADSIRVADSTRVADSLQSAKEQEEALARGKQFMSDDLKAFGYHGQVKSATITECNCDDEGNATGKASATRKDHSFTQDGMFLGSDAYSHGTVHRDKNGKMDKFVWAWEGEDADGWDEDEYISFTFNSEGFIETEKSHLREEAFTTQYTYDADGNLVKKVSTGNVVESSYTETYTYTILEKDIHDNWTSRIEHFKRTVDFDTYISPASHTKLQKREIVYY